MSNEQTGKLIDLVKAELPRGDLMDRYATAIVGELQSRYRIEPLENTVEKPHGRIASSDAPIQFEVPAHESACQCRLCRTARRAKP